MRERDSCGQHGCGPGEVEGDGGDVGAGDQEGEEGQGGALRGEGEEPEEDWVLLNSLPVDSCADEVHWAL